MKTPDCLRDSLSSARATVLFSTESHHEEKKILGNGDSTRVKRGPEDVEEVKEEMASQTLSWRWPMGVVEVEQRKKGRRGRVEIGGTLSHARTMGRREEGDMLVEFERVTVGGRREGEGGREGKTKLNFRSNSIKSPSTQTVRLHSLLALWKNALVAQDLQAVPYPLPSRRN